MARFHATSKGPVKFTAAEEAARDLEEAEAALKVPQPDRRVDLAAAIDAATADAGTPAKIKAVLSALKAVV